jgi:hypothetical protein
VAKTLEDPFFRDVRAGVTTVPAEALAKAGQLNRIVRVSNSALLILFQFKISIEGRAFLLFYPG